MHSGASVAQPCFACGAGRETRTPTPKRWYLKPMRLPIPPYPHVGRRYVTMFRKGQARRSPRLSFPPDFSHPPRRWQETAALPAYSPPAPGTARNSRTEAFWEKKRQAAPHPPPIAFPTYLARHIACRQARKTGNIYAATLTLYIACPAAQVAGLPAPSPNRRFRASAPCPAPYPFISHAFALPNPRAITKSTQIGHKLCMNRRNQPDLPACIALRA